VLFNARPYPPERGEAFSASIFATVTMPSGSGHVSEGRLRAVAECGEDQQIAIRLINDPAPIAPEHSVR
jgi:hypothetical protein